DRTNSKQGIAALQRMVEEAEGPIPLHGDEPERQLGHLHSHRIDVHAIKTTVGDHTSSNCDPLIWICWNQTLGWRASRECAFWRNQHFARMLLLKVLPRFDEPLRHVAADLLLSTEAAKTPPVPQHPRYLSHGDPPVQSNGARRPQAEKRDPPFGSRLAIHIHRLRQPLPRGGRSSLDGIGWRRLRQCYDGELFRHARMRTPGTPPLQDPGGGAHGRVRLHRRLLQCTAQALGARISVAGGVRAPARDHGAEALNIL